jgi:hypothetical protein
MSVAGEFGVFVDVGEDVGVLEEAGVRVGLAVGAATQPAVTRETRKRYPTLPLT